MHTLTLVDILLVLIKEVKLVRYVSLDVSEFAVKW